MKLIRIKRQGTGLLVTAGGIEYAVSVLAGLQAAAGRRPDLAELLDPYFVPGGSWRPLIEDWAALRDPMGELLELIEGELQSGTGRLAAPPIGQADLAAPLADPHVRVFAAGGNFPSHAAAMAGAMTLPGSVRDAPGDDVPPWGFYVIPGTIVGPGAVIRPPAATRYLDYEAEVGVILGAGGHPAGREEVHVWGFTSWNDFSIRDAALGLSKTDHGPLTWSLTKNFRTGNSCGPAVVVDGEQTLAQVRIRCRVNGELRQDGVLADMQYSFSRMAAHIAEYAPLDAGDMILSGTPGGTAMERGLDGRYLDGGDVVEVEVDGVGPLRNQVAQDYRSTPSPR
jgi:2-keto-4-pentenoate hydratase/2-oxohepta-3-ene-1,7-dioic acid hydratase in catechol pathway